MALHAKRVRGAQKISHAMRSAAPLRGGQLGLWHGLVPGASPPQGAPGSAPAAVESAPPNILQKGCIGAESLDDPSPATDHVDADLGGLLVLRLYEEERDDEEGSGAEREVHAEGQRVSPELDAEGERRGGKGNHGVAQDVHAPDDASADRGREHLDGREANRAVRELVGHRVQHRADRGEGQLPVRWPLIVRALFVYTPTRHPHDHAGRSEDHDGRARKQQRSTAILLDVRYGGDRREDLHQAQAGGGDGCVFLRELHVSEHLRREDPHIEPPREEAEEDHRYVDPEGILPVHKAHVGTGRVWLGLHFDVHGSEVTSRVLQRIRRARTSLLHHRLAVTGRVAFRALLFEREATVARAEDPPHRLRGLCPRICMLRCDVGIQRARVCWLWNLLLAGGFFHLVQQIPQLPLHVLLDARECLLERSAGRGDVPAAHQPRRTLGEGDHQQQLRNGKGRCNAEHDSPVALAVREDANQVRSERNEHSDRQEELIHHNEGAALLSRRHLGHPGHAAADVHGHAHANKKPAEQQHL
eukprot:scaffold417_cov252-Pinguiococcus_pyrenoidosus.AAC.1